MPAPAYVSITYRYTPSGGMTYGKGPHKAESFKVEASLGSDHVATTVEFNEGQVNRLRFALEPKALRALARAIISVADGDIRSTEGKF